MQKLSLELGRPNYVIMRGDVVVSGVFVNYSNALKEMYRRIWRCKTTELPDSPYPPFKLVELNVSAMTIAMEGAMEGDETTEDRKEKVE